MTVTSRSYPTMLTTSCQKLHFQLIASVDTLTCSNLRWWCSLMCNHWLSTSVPFYHFSPSATTLRVWQVCWTRLCGVFAFSPVRVSVVGTHRSQTFARVCALIKQTDRSSPPPIRSDSAHVCHIWVMTCSTLGWEHWLFFSWQKHCPAVLKHSLLFTYWDLTHDQ